MRTTSIVALVRGALAAAPSSRPARRRMGLLPQLATGLPDLELGLRTLHPLALRLLLLPLVVRSLEPERVGRGVVQDPQNDCETCRRRRLQEATTCPQKYCGDGTQHGSGLPPAAHPAPVRVAGVSCRGPAGGCASNGVLCAASRHLGAVSGRLVVQLSGETASMPARRGSAAPTAPGCRSGPYRRRAPVARRSRRPRTRCGETAGARRTGAS